MVVKITMSVKKDADGKNPRLSDFTPIPTNEVQKEDVKSSGDAAKAAAAAPAADVDSIQSFPFGPSRFFSSKTIARLSFILWQAFKIAGIAIIPVNVLFYLFWTAAYIGLAIFIVFVCITMFLKLVDRLAYDSIVTQFAWQLSMVFEKSDSKGIRIRKYVTAIVFKYFDIMELVTLFAIMFYIFQFHVVPTGLLFDKNAYYQKLAVYNDLSQLLDLPILCICPLVTVLYMIGRYAQCCQVDKDSKGPFATLRRELSIILGTHHAIRAIEMPIHCLYFIVAMFFATALPVFTGSIDYDVVESLRMTQFEAFLGIVVPCYMMYLAMRMLLRAATKLCAYQLVPKEEEQKDLNTSA